MSFQLQKNTSITQPRCQAGQVSFRARPPSKIETCSCETEVFVRDFPQKVENVQTKLSCETSPEKMKMEDIKAKLWCATSLKNVCFRSAKSV